MTRPHTTTHQLSESAWTDQLLSLPDPIFLALLSNYLGPVQSPYSKQDLIHRLLMWFQDEETQRRIAQSLSPEQARIVTRIWIFGTDTCGDGADDPSMQTGSDSTRQRRIRNLQERCLIGFGSKGLAIAPTLSPRTLQVIVSKSRMFACGSAERSPAAALMADNLFVAALWSLSVPGFEAFRRDGSMSSRASSTLSDLIDTATDTEARRRDSISVVTAFELWTRAALSLGLAVVQDGVVTADEQGWYTLATMPAIDRWALLTASGVPGTGAAHIIRDLGMALAADGAETDPVILEHDALRHIISCMAHTNGRPASVQDLTELATTAGLRDPHMLQRLRTMIATERTHEDERAHGQYAGHPPLVTFQPPATVTIMPGAQLRYVLPIARIGDLQRLETAAQFTLSAARYVGARSRGMSLEHILQCFRALGCRQESAVEVLLNRWESDFQATRIRTGTCVQVPLQRAVMLRNVPEFVACVEAEISPGVFWLRDDTYPDWHAALTKAGLSTHLQSLPAKPVRSSDRTLASPAALARPSEALLRTLGQALSQAIEEPDARTSPGAHPKVFPDVQARLDDIPEGSYAQGELAGRARRGLILRPEQINQQALPGYLIQEAKGFDYSAKVRLAEQASRDGRSELELTLAGSTFRVLPRSVQKRGPKAILECEREGETDEIDLGKVVYVRRFSASLV